MDIVSPRSGAPAVARQDEIVRLLPVENGDVLYRIKSKGEAFERVASRASFRAASPSEGRHAITRVRSTRE